jgi:multiple sugar transport system permease protein
VAVASPYKGLTSPSKGAAAVGAHVVLALIAVLFLAPLAWMLLASVDDGATLTVAMPERPTLANFEEVLTAENLRAFGNGILLSAGSGLVAMLAATLAAYPLSRFNLRFGRPFLYTILFATGLPITAIMVPVYGLFVQLDLLDSRPATMLFLAATGLPFAIWLMKNFMDGVPVSLEEAAWVDGASGLQALRRVVLPLMLPGAAVVFIFMFILTWGNFFVPFILLLTPEKQPAAVAIFQFFSQYGQVTLGPLAAYSILYSVPVIALYAAVQRTLSGAFSLAGAVKG